MRKFSQPYAGAKMYLQDSMRKHFTRTAFSKNDFLLHSAVR